MTERYSIVGKEETLEWIRVSILKVAIELYTTIIYEIQLSLVES